MRVAIVERELVGDERSYWACIPSKTLLRPGEEAHAAREARRPRRSTSARRSRGASSWSPSTDAGQERWLASQGIDLLHGRGRLAGPGVVEVDGIWTNGEAGPAGGALRRTYEPAATTRCDIGVLACTMPRWQPDTQERLVQAALDLYTEQGYERTTVGEIADRVGVTSRTYFRYFPDKREVLFASGLAIREAIVAATSRALEIRPAFEAVLIGVTAGRDVFQTREFARTRAAVIATSEELHERELMKIASISAALTTLLVDAGCDEATARITADAGVAVFVEATRRWQGGNDAPFGELVRQAAQLLREAATTQAAPVT